MALITDYTSLISEVKVWLRDSNTTDDTVKGWIQLAEARFKRVLATLDNEVTVTSVPSDEFDALPTGFNGLREAFVEGSPNCPLTLITPPQMRSYGNLSGLATYIAIVAGQFEFSPSAEGSTVSYTYVRKLDNLTVGEPTNYLITEDPDIYLSATLAVAQKQLRDDVDFSQHIDIVNSFIQELRDQDKRIKWMSQRKQVGVQPVVANLG